MWPFTSKRTAPMTAQQTAGGTIGGEAPRPFTLPAKPMAKHQTTADVLDYHCRERKATYERQVVGGKVQIRVHLPSGDTLSGTGATTLEAVTAVVRKLEAAA